METVNCIRCDFHHKDNGNCTAVGGFCTAVTAAHCPLLREYLDTRLKPEEVLPKDKADEIALKLMRLADLESLCSYDRLRELAEADKDGRVEVLPCKVGDRLYEVTGRKTISVYKVKAIRVELFGLFIEWDIVEGFVWQSLSGINAEEIGKTVFLTREEAEKALEAMKNVCP